MSETKIIAFEGIDGTGKSVQMEQLRAKLEQQGLTVGVLSFPDYGSFFGGCVGRYLTKKDGVSASDVDQRSMALWFAMDRWAAFQGFDYSRFDVLLINRYVLSNAVYQSIRDRDVDKPDILDFVLALEHRQLKLPQPDLYLILDVDLTAAQSNVSKKGYRDYVGDEKDEYEKQDSIQIRARAKYLSFGERLDNVQVIPCMADGALLSIETIAQRVYAAVKGIL
jgi:dTMP kinase